MGSDLSKEVADACKAFDLKRLTELFDSEDGQKFDPFEIIEKAEDILECEFDCLSLLLKNADPKASLMPFFELIKQQIDKVNSKRNETSQSKAQVDRFQCTYLERLIALKETTGVPIDEFNFFIDNSDIFPLKAENDPDCPILLHLLASNRNSLPLLQDYLSSGKVDEVFKNSNNDGEKMKHAYKYDRETPIVVACQNSNIEAVRELVVNNIGGANYCEAIERMLTTSLNVLENEDAAVEICLCLLSQPDADKICNRIFENRARLNTTGLGRAGLLEIDGSSPEQSKMPLSTAAFVIGADKLRAALLANGCVPQKDKLKSIGLVECAKDRRRLDDVRKIVQELRVQEEICVDLNLGGALREAARCCLPEITMVLLEAGCSVNQLNDGIANGRDDPCTPLHACLTKGWAEPDVSEAGRMQVLELLIVNGGALLNVPNQAGQTPLHLLIEHDHSDDVLKKFFELTTTSKELTTNKQTLDVDITGGPGDTALHLAMKKANATAVELLVPLSNIHINNKDGFSCKELAEKGEFGYTSDGEKRVRLRKAFGVLKEK